jgi:hypothetical protein
MMMEVKARCDEFCRYNSPILDNLALALPQAWPWLRQGWGDIHVSQFTHHDCATRHP